MTPDRQVAAVDDYRKQYHTNKVVLSNRSVCQQPCLPISQSGFSISQKHLMHSSLQLGSVVV